MYRIIKNRPFLLPILLGLLLSFALGAVATIVPSQVVILAVAFLLVVILLISKYRYDFLLYACLAIFILTEFQTSVIDLSRWVILVLLGLSSAYLIRKQKISVNPVALGLGLIALYAMLTSPLSYYPIVSLLKGISLLLLAGLALLVPPGIQKLYPHLGAKKYVLRMYLHVAIILVISNAIYFLIAPSLSLLGGRFRGWFVNPNGIGAVYGVFLVPILGYETRKQKNGWIRLGLFFVFLFAVFELMASGSRAGILSGVISLLVLILGARKWPASITMTILLGLFLIAIYLNDPANNIFHQFIYRNEIVLGGSTRLTTWYELWNSFLTHPFLGSGLGVANTGSSAQGLVFSTGAYTIEKTNSYLGVLDELGIVGATILGVALLIPILRSCWKWFNERNAVPDSSNLVIISVIFAGLLNATFEAWLLSVGSLLTLSFWIFASLLNTGSDPGKPGLEDPTAID